MDRIHWTHFNNMENIIHIDKETTEKLLPEIKQKFGKK